jgi:hypothetical protein
MADISIMLPDVGVPVPQPVQDASVVEKYAPLPNPPLPDLSTVRQSDAFQSGFAGVEVLVQVFALPAHLTAIAVRFVATGPQILKKKPKLG